MHQCRESEKQGRSRTASDSNGDGDLDTNSSIFPGPSGRVTFLANLVFESTKRLFTSVQVENPGNVEPVSTEAMVRINLSARSLIHLVVPTSMYDCVPNCRSVERSTRKKKRCGFPVTSNRFGQQRCRNSNIAQCRYEPVLLDLHRKFAY